MILAISLTRWLAFSDPIAQTPPPANALEDIATTLNRDLLLPLLVAPFDEEFVTALLFVEVEELGEDENADRGSVDANLNIVSHSSSHSFSVRISPYCMFWMWDCHLHRLYIADETSPMDRNVCNAFLKVNSRSWKPYMPTTHSSKISCQSVLSLCQMSTLGDIINYYQHYLMMPRGVSSFHLQMWQVAISADKFLFLPTSLAFQSFQVKLRRTIQSDPSQEKSYTHLWKNNNFEMKCKIQKIYQTFHNRPMPNFQRRLTWIYRYIGQHKSINRGFD